jgi:hypothetical protein
MQQDSNQQREQPHILDQVVVPALPPEFQHADISRQYRDGEFTSRLDAEIEDILRGCQPAGESGETAPITLSGDAASALEGLHCIALIQGGQVLPLLVSDKKPGLPNMRETLTVKGNENLLTHRRRFPSCKYKYRSRWS